jgi:hypothetical protein
VERTRRWVYLFLSHVCFSLGSRCILVDKFHLYETYNRVFRAQANWTLTHTSHKDTEQSTIDASITLDGVTLTDSLIRRSPNE